MDDLQSIIKSVILKEFGNDAELLSWQERQSPVTGYMRIIEGEMSINGMKRKCEYIYKPNSTPDVYLEEKMYDKVIPKINKYLQGDVIHTPKHVFSSKEAGKAMTIFSIYDPERYKFFDIRTPLDKDHINILISELAKLHSGSYLLLQKNGLSDVIEDCPEIIENGLENISMIEDALGLMARVLENMDDKYNKIGDWLDRIKDSGLENVISNLVYDCLPSFQAISISDGFENNFRFRYNESSIPVDGTLSSFNRCKLTSVALGINNLLYTTTTNGLRESEKSALLQKYHEVFGSILKANNTDVPFSIEELTKEVDRKNEFGFIMAIVSTFLMANDTLLKKLESANTDEQINMLTKKILEDGFIKTRLHDISEEILQFCIKRENEATDVSEFISEAAVSQAVKSDKGQKAKLVSWSIKDFTKPGDNMATFVTCIKAIIYIDNKIEEVSYITKLNPCRKSDLWNSIVYPMFYQEVTFFDELLVKINKYLNKNNTKLGAPASYYTSLVRDREVMINEDLRPLGYKMFVKKNPMDLEHTLLIIKELAKLHAGSHVMIREEGKEAILKNYPCFDYDFFGHKKICGDGLFNEWMAHQFETFSQILTAIGSYEDVILWFKEIKEFTKIPTEIVHRYSDSFAAIAHGDCWNNNLLFKYGNDGKPDGAVLLDFQCGRVSSLAVDLNHFIFTSTTGNLRKEKLDFILRQYYEAFSDIIQANGKDMLFTFEELVEEFVDKNVFGYLMSLGMGPFLIIEPEEFPVLTNDMNDEVFNNALEGLTNSTMMEKLIKTQLFKDRILSLMDEIKEYINTNLRKNPLNLIGEEDVIKSIKKESGKEGTLISWYKSNVTKPGDNMATNIVGIDATFEIDGKFQEFKYISKINPNIRTDSHSKFGSVLFQHEVTTLCEIVPILNEYLGEMVPLRVPKCYNYSLQPTRETMVNNDLRVLGFRMRDKMQPLNFDEIKLLTQEFAKLHSTSAVYIQDSSVEQMLMKFPILQTDPFFDLVDDPKYDMLESLFSSQLKTILQMINILGDFKHAPNWIEGFSKDTIAQMSQFSKFCDPRFSVLNHGDCWNNNFLFRYDDEDKIQEIMLLDLQCTRISSIGFDLNYLFYANTTTAFRDKHLDELLQIYYDVYSKIFKENGKQMKFTKDELMKNFQENYGMGFAFGLVVGLLFVSDLEGAPQPPRDLTDEKGMTGWLESIHKFANMAKDTDLFKSRVTDLIQEIDDFVCNSMSKTKTIKYLSKEQAVKEAIKKDKGPNAKLVSWYISDSTSDDGLKVEADAIVSYDDKVEKIKYKI